jgi:YHS domain-containing protein
MKKLALGLLAFVFALSLNLTWAQDKTDSKDVKKPEVTKPTDVQKSTDVTKSKNITKTPNVTKIDVTKTPNVKSTDVTKTAVVTAGTGKPVNTVCIVSGEEFDSKITADYKGKTYAFCCKKCLAKFYKDPEKYVAKFDKQSNKSKN